MNSYSYDKKKRLADKIAKLKKKEDMIHILEIIYENNKNITENQNGLFLLFDKLDDNTYLKIENYLKGVSKKTTSDGPEKKEYKSYFSDDFSEQSSLNPKLKYSNKEKNLIKRNRYDNYIASEHASETSVVYTKFDINRISESDKALSEPDSPQQINKKTNTTKRLKKLNNNNIIQ